MGSAHRDMGAAGRRMFDRNRRRADGGSGGGGGFDNRRAARARLDRTDDGKRVNHRVRPRFGNCQFGAHQFRTGLPQAGGHDSARAAHDTADAHPHWLAVAGHEPKLAGSRPDDVVVNDPRDHAGAKPHNDDLRSNHARVAARLSL